MSIFMYFSMCTACWWWSGSVGSVVDRVIKVNQHQAQLVLGWVTKKCVQIRTGLRNG